MNTFELRDNNGTRYTRVSKRVARKVFAARVPFVICACNLQPFGGWSLGMRIDESNYVNYDLETVCLPDSRTSENGYHGVHRPYTLDDLSDNFESYNCTCSETGMYASFYVRPELLTLAK